jgi:hypothetical protein
VAYIPCYACQEVHARVPYAHVAKALEQFQAGNGQRVTKYGVEPICILEVIEMPETGNLTREKDGHLVLSVA